MNVRWEHMIAVSTLLATIQLTVLCAHVLNDLLEMERTVLVLSLYANVYTSGFFVSNIRK